MIGFLLMSYAIGSLFLLKSFVKDITNDIKFLNLEAIISDGNWDGKNELMTKHFIEVVQEFLTVKELSQQILMKLCMINLLFLHFVLLDLPAR